MKPENSKLLLGLLAGAAVGAAIGYFAACDDRDEIIDKIGGTVDKAKKKISKAINDGIEELDVAVDKVNTLAHSAISRAKAAQGGEA